MGRILKKTMNVATDAFYNVTAKAMLILVSPPSSQTAKKHNNNENKKIKQHPVPYH